MKRLLLFCVSGTLLLALCLLYPQTAQAKSFEFSACAGLSTDPGDDDLVGNFHFMAGMHIHPAITLGFGTRIHYTQDHGKRYTYWIPARASLFPESIFSPYVKIGIGSGYMGGSHQGFLSSATGGFELGSKKVGVLLEAGGWTDFDRGYIILSLGICTHFDIGS